MFYDCNFLWRLFIFLQICVFFMKVFIFFCWVSEFIWLKLFILVNCFFPFCEILFFVDFNIIFCMIMVVSVDFSCGNGCYRLCCTSTVAPTLRIKFEGMSSIWHVSLTLTQHWHMQWRSQDYCKARAKKICNTFIGVYIRNCKQIIKKSREIAQFIGVYIRNS